MRAYSFVGGWALGVDAASGPDETGVALYDPMRETSTIRRAGEGKTLDLKDLRDGDELFFEQGAHRQSADFEFRPAQTIDGVPLVPSTRVELKRTGRLDGIWVVTSGSWDRPSDFG